MVVGGFFAYQYFVENGSQDQNQIAGWRTHTSDEYGFEFKYPNNWKLEQLGYGTVLKSPDFDYLDAEIDSKVLKGSWVTIRKSYTKFNSVREYLGDDYAYIKNAKDIKVDNVYGLEFYYSWESPEKLFTELIKDHYLYLIMFEGVGEEREDKDYPVVKEIISTFKFTK